MAEQIVGLSEHDVKVLKELIASVRARPLNTAGRTFTDDPPDTIASYIIKTPSAGIPARAGAGVSAATCRVYQRVDSDLVDAGFDRTVYNATGAAIDGNIYTTATRDPWGTLWADDVAGTGTTSGGSGITSINDSTTASQTIGLGSAGTDINIATTGVAYSAGVVYSRGMIATSGGSIYRYTNATPSAGNAPPNAAYWVDVTGDALLIVNVPDASPTADGIITTGTQIIVGFKTFQNAFGTRFTDGSGNGEIELGDPSTDGGAVGYGITLNRLVMTAVADTTYSVTAILYVGSQFPQWNSATAYVPGDKVTLNGAGWNCILSHTNQYPVFSPTYWETLPSSYAEDDKPRLVLSGGNTASGADTTSTGSKPVYTIEDAGIEYFGTWGTGGGGDTIVGGLVTALGSPPTGATVGYTPSNSADWSGDPTDVAAALNRLAAAVAGLLGTAVP